MKRQALPIVLILAAGAILGWLGYRFGYWLGAS